MRKIALAMVAVLGLTACVKPSTNAGLCLAQRDDMAALRVGLRAHPETPDAVGEPATDLVIGYAGACG